MTSLFAAVNVQSHRLICLNMSRTFSLFLSAPVFYSNCTPHTWRYDWTWLLEMLATEWKLSDLRWQWQVALQHCQEVPSQIKTCQHPRNTFSWGQKQDCPALLFRALLAWVWIPGLSLWCTVFCKVCLDWFHVSAFALLPILASEGHWGVDDRAS